MQILRGLGKVDILLSFYDGEPEEHLSFTKYLIGKKEVG